MSINPFDEVRAAVGKAEDDAQREYRELGVSLRVANEERERLEELANAQWDVIIRICGNEDAADTLVSRRVAERREAKQ